VSKKSSKVEEPTTAYIAKKPAKVAPVTITGKADASDAAFKRATDKIFTERKELLRKLAQ
jgi:hypothetical protein